MHKLKEYTATNKALKQQLLHVVDKAYYWVLWNRVTGYASVSMLELLKYLYTIYGKMSASILFKNEEQIKKTYNPSLHFETLINQVNKGIEFVVAGYVA